MQSLLFIGIIIATNFFSTVSKANGGMCADLFPTTAIEKEYQAFESQRTASYKSLEDHKSMLADSHYASKRKIFEELGYEFTDRKMLTPSFEQFVSNYNKALDKRGIPHNLRLQPSLVLKRELETGLQVDFLTPGKDPWPEDSNIHVFNPAIDRFNIPAKATMKALRAGRWPLLDSFHDASHFASFIENPGYMMAIVKSIQGLPPLQKGSSIPSRIFSNLEILALADPTKIPAIRSLLQTPEVKYATSFLPLKTFLEKIDSMPEADLIQHAETIVDNYHLLLKEYGAAVYRPYEKNEVLSFNGGTGGAPKPVLRSHLTRENDANVTDANSNTFAIHTPNRIKAFLELLKSNPPPTLKELDFLELHSDAEIQPMLVKLIREQVALAEYILWNSSHIPVENWIQISLGSEVISPNNPVAIMTRDVFGPTSYQYLMLMKANKPTQPSHE